MSLIVEGRPINPREPAVSPVPLPRRERPARVAGARKIAAALLPAFSRKFAAMLDAGMPIVAALKALEHQEANRSFRQVIFEVRIGIENGLSLSESLAPFPQIFDDLYVSMVRGGESGGRLPETVTRLAEMLEARAALRRRVRGALIYPIVVLTIAVAIAAGLTVFVVPVFADMFTSLKKDLPAPTKFLMDLSARLRARGLYAVLGLVAAIVLFRQWKSTAGGAYILDRIALSLPICGPLARKLAAARFAGTFAPLVRSGVPLLSALDIAAAATGNRAVGRAILRSRHAVENGESLSTALASCRFLPPELIDMLQAGEKTGRVDDMMDSLAGYYNEEVNATLGGLTSLLEPLLIVVLGIVIGGMVIALLLPLFRLPGMFQ